MESVFTLTAQLQQRPTPSRPRPWRAEQQRLVSSDKYQLEQMIRSEQRRGWVLLSRSYSLDDGHGATLVLADHDEADLQPEVQARNR